MIDEVEIGGFRGIRSGRLGGLGRLTVLTGTNGCGKSAVLDAVLLGAATRFGDALVTVVGRHPNTLSGARWLQNRSKLGVMASSLVVTTNGTPSSRAITVTQNVVPDRRTDLERPIDQVVITESTGQKRQGGAWFDADGRGQVFAQMHDAPENPRIVDPGLPVPLHDLWSDVVRSGRETEVTDLVRSVDPDIHGLRVLTEASRSSLYVSRPGAAVPVALSRDGVQAFLQVATAIASSGVPVVLVEEPEVYQHPRTLQATARMLWSGPRRDVQIVVTTHSLELIDDLLQEAGEDLDKLVVFNLALTDGELRSARFAGTDVSHARDRGFMDLR